MDFVKLSLGPLGTNCYIISKQNQAIIIDPGGDSDQIIDKIADTTLTPAAILLTHAHFDHIGAVDDIRDHYHIPVYVHEFEADWLKNPNLNGSALFRTGVISINPPDHFITNGQINVGSLSFEVRHTPGHSPGSVSFIFHDQQVVIGGDTLFQSGIGRTDLPGGDFDQLITSIKSQLFTLSDQFAVYPGHGPATKIGIEKRTNPFFNHS